jgi:hypothetical protein
LVYWFYRKDRSNQFLKIKMGDDDGKKLSVGDYRDETGGNKFWLKCKENPFIPFGIAAGIGACAFAAFNYKNIGRRVPRTGRPC